MQVARVVHLWGSTIVPDFIGDGSMRKKQKQLKKRNSNTTHNTSVEHAVNLIKLEQFKEAIACLRRSLEINPDQFLASAYLARALERSGQRNEALAIYLQVNDQYGFSVEVGWNIAGTLRDLGRIDEAIPWFRKACEQAPNNQLLNDDYTLARLSTGDLTCKWDRRTGIHREQLKADIPTWTREPLNGRAILLWADQGYGDNIQFIRYANVVKELGGTSAIYCLPEQSKILSTSLGVHHILSHGTTAKISYQASLVDMPSILGETPDTITAIVPYIMPDISTVAYWRERLTTHGIKIGVAWQGNPKHTKDMYRSFPLNKFERISRLTGVTLYSLQKGFGSEQLATATFPVVDLGPEINDFMDTAAIMANLDLMIVPDTAVAHLSGALARPTWTLLQHVADWRWFHDRTDSPWYPTMRLFRQPKWNDWDSVFREVEVELRKIISG